MLRVSTALLVCALAMNLLGTEVMGDEDCPDPNQEWDSCGSACPLNCDNHNDGYIPCYDACVSGCFCKDGYVFQSGTSGPCVPTSECP